MGLIYYLIKEFGRILFKENYKQNSSLLRSIRLYRVASSEHKKTMFKVLKETIQLFNYWKAFPNIYFSFGMFSKSFTDFEIMKSFIPQEAYNRYAISNDPRYNILIDDKILFHDLLSQYELPVPYRFFTFRNGIFRSGAITLSDVEVDNIISSIDDKRIFVKRFTGGAASGVSVVTLNSEGKFIDQENNVLSAEMIRNKYISDDIFFEKAIIQEYELARFNPDTVNTIRVLTYKNKIISGTVRFGGKGEIVDNISVNGIAVSIDVETGSLGTYGQKLYSCERYDSHPDSQIPFKGVIISQWPEVRKLVSKTLMLLPYYKSVGFDIATTDSGPVIVEINTGAGMELSQMGKDIGIAEYFELS